MSSLFIFLVALLVMLSYIAFLFVTAIFETPPETAVGIRVDAPRSRTHDTTVTTTGGSNSTKRATTTAATSTAITTTMVSTTTTVTTTTRTAAPIVPRPMGKRPLFCTFGTFEQDYEKIAIDGVCDYAFVPLYSRGRDTLLDDSHPVLRTMLERAANARSTSYGISIPQRKYFRVLRDMQVTRGISKVREYWTTWKVLHYGVLDMEVKPKNLAIRRKVKETFSLLKALRFEQQRLEKASPPQPPSPTRGFIVLGFRIWPQNMGPVLRSVSQELRKFMVDGVIALTHVWKDEFVARYPGCWVTGPAPFEVSPQTQAFHMLGMSKTMEAIRNQTEWNAYPSLAVSVTMCTRLYMTMTSRRLYAPCVDHQQPPNTMSAFCKDPLNIYVDQVMDEEQFTMISKPAGSGDLLATYESSMTIITKICNVIRDNWNLDVGLAMFDVDCEDWAERCPSSNAGGQDPAFDISGHSRFSYSADYFQVKAKHRTANATSCP